MWETTTNVEDVPPRLTRSPAVLSVLVVEDNPGDAELVIDHLGQMTWARFEVTHSPTFANAVGALERSRPDVLLLDLTLPDGSGPAMIRQLRERAPGLAIVVLTGRDDDETEHSAVQIGAQEFLRKNRLSTGDLSRSIRHAIERERLSAQIRALVMAHVDATVVVGNDRTIRFVNPAAERLFGKPRHTLLGQPFPYSLAQVEQAVDLELIDKDEVRYLEMRTTQFDWQGEPSFLASLRDVTDRKRAEQLQAKLLHADRLASIGQLAAGVAHEVNNPAAFVLGNLSVMTTELDRVESFLRELRGAVVVRDGVETSADALLARLGLAESLAELRTMTHENQYGVNRIVKLVRDLNSFSRIDRDEIEELDLNDVVRVACAMTTNEVRHRAELVRDLAELPLVSADRGKLAQVFTNLLVNAAHAIEPAAAHRNRITVTTRHLGGSVIVSVEDTGSGMTDEVKRRLFEPFFTTKPPGHGSGLGLSISAEIVRKHGGELTVTSTAGRGSRFEVRLPLSGPLTPSALVTPVPGTLPVLTRRARVLVIDDEPLVLKSLARMLERSHEVVTAEGGQRALEVLASDDRFDVIVCDLMMPVADGEAVFDVITRHLPELRSRVLFCSGGAFTPRAKAFVASLHNGVLDKPISADDLLRAIEQVLTATAHEVGDLAHPT